MPAPPPPQPKATHLDFPEVTVAGALERPTASALEARGPSKNAKVAKKVEVMAEPPATQELEPERQQAELAHLAALQKAMAERELLSRQEAALDRSTADRRQAGQGAVLGALTGGGPVEKPRPRPVPPPSAVSNPVDELVHQLASANAAFNTPERMVLDEAQTIQLLLSPVHSQEALAGMVRGAGPKVTVQVRYNHRMRASLQVDPKDPDANAFLIEALSPGEQAVSGEEVTSWTWKVTPKAPGTHYLTLDLSVLLDLDHAPVPRSIKQINRTIEIQVRPRRWGQWWIPGLLAAGGLVGGVVLVRRRRTGTPVRVRSAPDPHLFISYARRDSARVVPLVEGLDRLGYRVWMDQTGIEGATLWSQEIVENMRAARVVLVFASKASFASEFVSREILLASEERKPILPLYLEEVEIPSTIRLQLTGIQHLLLHPGREEEDLGAIARALSRLGVEAH